MSRGATLSFRGLSKQFEGGTRVEVGDLDIKAASFTVLLGRCRVHDALGGFEEIGPGEGLYIPPGFAGEFEVLEALTKTYMIAE